MNEQKFNVGDEVEWSSQSNASQVVKFGKVVMAVKPLVKIWRAIEHHNKFGGNINETRYRFMFDSLQSSRDHFSYLVEVNDSKTGRGKPKLYWPRVSYLKNLSR